MKRSITKIWGVLAIVAGMALGTSSTAEAAIKLKLTDVTNAVSTTITDDGAGDLAAGDPGTVVFFGAVGAWTLNVTTGIVTPDTVLPEVMHLNSVDTSNAAGELKIEFTATGLSIQALNTYLGLAPLFPAGGSITYNAYVDAGNGEFATTTLLPAALSGTYSLTQVVTIKHAGAGTSSFDANIVVPEPASLSLLGLGLAGLAVLRRRRAAVR